MRYIKLLFKRILIILVGVILISLFIFFHLPSVKIASFIVYNPLYDTIKDFPLWLYLTSYFIAISFINVLIFFVLSLYFSYIQAKKERLRKSYEDFFNGKLCDYFLTERYLDQKLSSTELEPFIAETHTQQNQAKLKQSITDYLLMEKVEQEGTRSEFFDSLRPFLKKDIQIEALFRVYIKYEDVIADDLSNKFKEIIHALSLQKHLKRLLYDHDLGGRILALKVLSNIRNTEYSLIIIRYIQHKNYALRTEAIAALIRIMNSDLQLHSDVGEKYNLSLLDINVILNAITSNYTKEIDVERLVKSENDRKKIMGLMLAKSRLVGAQELCIHHVGNDLNIIKKIEWHLLVALFPAEDAINSILKNFNKENNSVKLSILKNASALSSTQFHSFLQQVIKQESLLLKIEGLRLLFKHNISLFGTYANSEDREIFMAYKEVSDMYIN